MDVRELWRVAKRQPARLARKRAGLTLRTALDDRALIALWWDALPNWGDIVNPVLIAHLAGREPVPYDRVLNVRGRTVYSVVGSLLDRVAVRHLEVWGSGFKSGDARCWIAPERVHAVRGPLTRDALERQGIACPPLYGDPALLFPRIYDPPRRAVHRLGVVAHYSDHGHPALDQLREQGDVVVIDILGGIERVADEIVSCRAVASSSLHGLIAADAYGVPNAWIELSDRVEGGGFKFRDHFGAVRGGRERRTPLRVRGDTTVQEILDHVIDRAIEIDLDALLAACPFLANPDGAVAA